MKVVIITDRDIDEVIAVYTLKRFIKEVNKEYYEANDFNGAREYFNLDSIDLACSWYAMTSDNLRVEIKEVETSLDDEV